jgi:hypothetical protein
MNQNNDISNIISLLQDIDIKTNFTVFIPSLRAEVNFKQLTTEQLKRLLKTVVDSPVYNAEFTLTFNEIIKENCLSAEINTNDLNIYDKAMILIKMRSESISPNYTIEFTPAEISENNLTENKTTISLTNLLTDFLSKNVFFADEIIQHNECSITVNLPTIATENKLERELHKNIKTDLTTPEDLRELIGETFINEVTKFITKVAVGDTIIDLLNISFKQRIKVVEKLPTCLINKVIKYIEKYRETIKPLQTVSITVPTTDNNTVVIEKDIPADASFFNM